MINLIGIWAAIVSLPLDIWLAMLLYVGVDIGADYIEKRLRGSTAK